MIVLAILREKLMCQQFSYSRVECFRKCPYQYQLKYIDKLKVIKNQDANHALHVGSAIHLGLEKANIKAAVNEYKRQYYAINDLHIHEQMKLEVMLKKDYFLC